MDVILLERVAKLGIMGEVVKVRNGYARNFLLPNGKALRATKDNRAKYEAMKSHLEARNLEARKEAEAVGVKLDGTSVVIVRQAGESGQLYGSVSTRDVAEALEAAGFTVDRQQIVLNHPIKTIGQHVLPVRLHPEVEVSVKVNVARSLEEAERLARGEDVRRPHDEDEDEEEVLVVEETEETEEGEEQEG